MQVLDMNTIPVMKNRIDTPLISIMPVEPPLKRRTIRKPTGFLNWAASYGYADKDPLSSMVFLKQSYFASGDTASGVKGDHRGIQ